jgi:hypothetical protein
LIGGEYKYSNVFSLTILIDREAFINFHSDEVVGGSQDSKTMTSKAKLMMELTLAKNHLNQSVKFSWSM